MPEHLILTMTAHLAWCTILYSLLTFFRAPKIWGIGKTEDGNNPFERFEPRTSANLSNQFEWPIFFHLACILAVAQPNFQNKIFLTFAILFLIGRLIHSFVQIFTDNIRLRGVVFTINFVAVLAMWITIIQNATSW